MNRVKLPRALLLGALLPLLAHTAAAQTPAPTPADKGRADAATTETEDDVRRQLREQREELERLRAAVREQTRLLEDLRARVERSEQASNVAAAANGPNAANVADASNAAGSSTAETRRVVFRDTLPGVSPEASAPQAAAAAKPDERLARVEEQVKRTSETVARQLGNISFSGDLRMRYEGFYGQLNALPNADNPALVGNELTTRQRFRLRARLALRGRITNEFEWGLRLSTGMFPDAIATNQNLTDFFTHKNFALDNAFLTYKPSFAPGLQVQGGKFDVPWLRTEMTIDNDLTTEGFNESYTREFKKSAFKSLTFVAWQLPMLERSSAFVLAPDGTLDVEASRRGGRDLALYGAQLRARFEPSTTVGLTLSAADLFFSGTQFITPAQFFGPNVQIPVTVRIPATATSPAQTVVAQVNIPREQLVAGNANLGVSIASNNATNRDGRLASGFNLVDLIARLDLTRSKRWPVMLLFNFVTNTQARDVVTAGAGGRDVILENNENVGYWAEVQAGKSQARGDWLFNYVYTRIEKDAVLTPFNASDISQQSDSRVQRLIATYTVDPRVTLSLNLFVTSRPNGLLGVFGATPPGSLNRPLTRLQFDTNFRF
ncbi:MAG TPA: putative porin [Pyrinomonadaceae bacterium]|nr:putative porin [Pyrinomonadaceae bacterium]